MFGRLLIVEGYYILQRGIVFCSAMNREALRLSPADNSQWPRVLGRKERPNVMAFSPTKSKIIQTLV